MADAEYARFESMTNVELRAELKRRGCPTSGNKKDLLAKLRLAIQKDYEQSTLVYSQNETPVTYTNQVDSQQPSLYNLSVPYPVISISPQIPISTSVEQEKQISSTPEQKNTRTRSKKLSVDSHTNDITAHSIPVNNEQIVLDTSNNVEVNSFVSKSNDEEQKNIDKIGAETLLPSIGGSSSSPKSESLLKEIPSSNEQQHVNQSETNVIPDIINNETKDESADVQPEIIKQQETIKSKTLSSMNEKPNRSQISSLSKISTRTNTNKINLTTELLQTLISDLSLVAESIVNDELDSEENNDSVLETSLTNDFLPTDTMTIGELADQKQPTNRTVSIDDLSGRKKPVRVSSFDGKTTNIVTDEPVRIKDPTTTHEPPSEILYIRGLTRPFSLMQLKGLLSRYGKLVEGEFWLDKIKSQCFATYQTLEEAQNAREALDGCRWPSTNPKTLSVRFARQEEFEFSKTHDLPPGQMSTDSTDRVVEESTSPHDETELKNNSDEAKLQKEKQSGFLITEEEEEEAGKTNDQPMKGLDDYFRKTKAKPSIYWLPLSEGQILERIHRQEQRNAERDEEQRKREVDDNVRRSDKRKPSSSPTRRDSKRH